MNQAEQISYFSPFKKCRICKRSNDTLHWHQDEETKDIWVYCIGKCQRAYSLYEYTAKSNLTLKEFLDNPPSFKESTPYEVQKMSWPKDFLSLFDKRAAPAIEYLKSRNIEIEELDLFYDIKRNGIVFPYRFQGVFVGAQIRFITPIVELNGNIRKIDTIPGTRTGYLFYGWDQTPFASYTKGIILTEGAFNSLVISQALNSSSSILNKWKCIASSGAGISQHKIDVLKQIKESGLKVILASDSDDAGMKMWEKAIKSNCITHYAFTENSNKDWNDIRNEMNKEDFGLFFLNKVRKV
jgi:hypothetical protein